MPNFIVCIGLSMGVCICNVHLSQLGSSKTQRKCGEREREKGQAKESNAI